MAKRRESSYSQEMSPIKVIHRKINGRKAEIKVFRKSGFTYFLTVEFPYIPNEEYPEIKDAYSLEKPVEDNTTQEFDFECEAFSVDDIDKNIKIRTKKDARYINISVKLLPMLGSVFFDLDFFR